VTRVTDCSRARIDPVTKYRCPWIERYFRDREYRQFHYLWLTLGAGLGCVLHAKDETSSADFSKP
jgi:hypothetical protein